MKEAQLAKMSLKELQKLENSLATAIARRRSEEKMAVKNKLSEIAQQAGFTVSELFGRRGKRGSSIVKYRHPQDPSLTWTGRGRKPNWLAKVTDIERFRIA